MSDEPTKPLSNTELEIAEMAGKGWGIKRIATETNNKAANVASTLQRIALKIPNPDDLKPLMLVALWAAHRRWIRDRKDAA